MTHVAIIGGGPAGLAASACLGDVVYTVLERGAEPLAALRRVDPEIQLLTPTAMSRLPGMAARPGAPHHMRFGELVEAIEAWRIARGLAVTTGAAVDAVERTATGFAIRHSRGLLACTHVINATGVISYPTAPPGARHSIDIRSADLATAHRLVVIGAGMSAAEVLERWLEVRPAGGRAWIVARGKVRATPASVLGIDIHWLTWLPEHLPGRAFGRRLAPRRDLIIGRAIVPALRDGTIQRIAPGDPAILAADLVVHATGFQYAAPHLGDLVERDADGWPIVTRHAESTRTPGLYLLGLRFGRSIASPYLRGIARDAEHVAERIRRAASAASRGSPARP